MGYTPHYKKTGNLELQQKVLSAYNDIDMAKQYLDKTKMENDCTIVTLHEGDILYHPAGIWHAVSSPEDSISINFSMRAMRTGDFVSQAIQGALFHHIDQRQFLKFEN